MTRGKAAPKQTNITKAKVDINKGIKNLSVEEPFKIKSKNLDVVAEYAKRKRKNAANFVVIGETFGMVWFVALLKAYRPC